MATGFTRQAATNILNKTISSGTYVALSTTTPDANGNNFTEPSPSKGYIRQRFGDVNNSIVGQIANDKIIFLFEATADCGSITHVGLSGTEDWGSDIFLMAELDAPLPVAAGYVPLIRARNFIVGLDKEMLEPYV